MKKVILLADEALFFLECEKTFFCREYFELRTAHTGVEVLEIVASASPDIIFLDMDMPEMNGDECCHSIKADEKTRHIPIIMVMASVKEMNLERCRQAGCDDIMLKPFSRDDILETVKKHLNIQLRVHPRYIASIRFHYGQDPEHLLTDYTLNLSTDGVYLKTMNLMEVGTPLMVEFVLPNFNIPLSYSARVAWVNPIDKIRNSALPVGMGIQFLGLRKESVNAIRSFISEAKLSPIW